MKIKKCAGTLLLIYAASIVLGLLANTFAFILPNEPVKENIRKDFEVLKAEMEPENYWVLENRDGAMLDLYTDALIMDTILFENNETHFYNAVAAPHHVDAEQRMQQTFLDVLEDNLEGKEAYEYTRYWHGYLLPVKLLLSSMSYQDARIFNLFLQLSLLGIAVKLIVKRKSKALAVPFCIAFAFLMPTAVAYCFQYSAVVYVTLIAVILWFCFQSFWERGWNWIPFFFTLGIVTNYFDLLTFPFLSLGIPAALVMFGPGCRKPAQQAVKFAVLCLAWACGYSSMWIAKWAVASIVLNENVFADALQQILLRTSDEVKNLDLTYTFVLNKNLELMQYPPYTLLFFVPMLCQVPKLIYLRSVDVKSFLSKAFIAACFVLLPLAWILVMRNHSFMHYFYTYRILIVASFAIQCAVFSFADELRQKKLS